MVHYDGTVRNSNKQLLQLRYGEDGMDGAKMEFQQLPCIKPSDAKFEQNFKFDFSNPRLVCACVCLCICLFVYLLVCFLLVCLFVYLLACCLLVCVFVQTPAEVFYGGDCA